MKRPLVLSLLLTSGCTDAMRVYLFPLEPDRDLAADEQLITDAAAWWGLDVIFEPEENSGVAFVVLIDDYLAKPYGGVTYRSAPCYATTTVRRRLVTVLHEVGHIYGLEHVDTPGNIMLPTIEQEDPGLYEATNGQRNTVADHVERMGRCVR